METIKSNKLLYFPLLFLIACIPFTHHYFKLFRGISVFFFHYFQTHAPTSVTFRPLFQKYIQFCFTEFEIIALIIMVFIFKKFSFKELFFNRHSRFLTLYSVVALFSIIFSLCSSYFFQYTTLINLTVSFIGFHLVYCLIKQNKNWIPNLLWAFVAIAGVECLVGIGQFIMQQSLGLTFLSEVKISMPFTPDISAIPLTESNRFLFDKLPWVPNDTPYLLRAYGTFIHPSVFGAYLLSALFITYFLVIKSKARWEKISLFTLIPLLIITLALTFSRGALFAWILGTILFFIVGLTNKGMLSPFEKKNFVHLGILLCAGLMITFSLLFNHFAARGGVVSYNEIANHSDSTRLTFFKIAAALFFAHPLMGIGYNGFALYPYETINPLFGIANADGNLPHNVYLQIASETGLFGLAAMLLFIFSLYRPVFSQKLSSLTLTLSVLIFSLMLTGLIDHILWATPSGRAIFFIFCGLLAGSYSGVLNGQTKTREPSSLSHAK